MNQNDIKTILEQLYEIDPSLRSREGEIVKIIRALALKPNAHYDKAFAADLRARLLTELAAPPSPWVAFVRRPAYAIAGFAVLAVAAAAAVILTVGPRSGGGNGSIALLSSKVAITRVGSDAFGDFASSSSPSSNVRSGAAPETSATQGSSGASAAPMATMAPAASPMSAAVTGVRPVPPVAYPRTVYEYTGGDFSQDKSQLDVLKKTTRSINAGDAVAALERSGFGITDLSSFGNLSLNNVTLDEQQSFGYQIALDFVDGTVSINENYSEWPQGSATPLGKADIPSDSAVIAIASGFLSDHGISTADYGSPSVQQLPYAIPASSPMPLKSGTSGAAGMPMIPYYPDTETVTYPLVVNGMDVYDQGGNPVGLTVNVNVRYGRVAEVYGLGTQAYDASAYDAITSTSTILSTAENREIYPRIYNGTADIAVPPTQIMNGTQTLDLGTPTMAYMQAYAADAGGTESQYLVPAFVFPVTAPGSSTVTQRIIVPLVKQFAENNPPIIVPLAK